MKHSLLTFLLIGVLLFSKAAYAQDSASGGPIQYNEKVLDDEAEASVLYKRAIEWSESHFAYTPKATLKADAIKGELRMTGTVKIKTATTSGQVQEHPVLFEFNFHALPDGGYDYSVGFFRVILDTRKPDETVPVEEYITQLGMDRNNSRTHNDRRVTAQSSSLVSEIAMSFRSYMNSRPAPGAIE
ncbi:hypothetical protein MTX78_21070 [Hymenobacter tibetensis]|uniref:DUF4468 domain-containing protein n=1 Tax=Hymenobacter tibetensis TaxID=497967 RepID=A0ABY4CX01_9BACT|nr:hypothetical protein [Hymenobacter tibetensis]UOG74596.1 hypothetical protein MTX78_21070 [Hymenobacter tibetensis]